MMPQFNSTLVKIYLVVGLCVCVFFGIGAIAGWKIPSVNLGSGSGRGASGFWGMGK